MRKLIGMVFLLTSGSVQAVSFTNIGTFAAGDAIAQLIGGPLSAGNSDYYVIEFTEPVLLSGTLAPTSAGDPDLFLWTTTVTGGDATLDALLDQWTTNGGESFSDFGLGTGDYLLQVEAWSGAGDLDSYALDLSTTPIPIPASAWLFASGLALLGWRRRRQAA